LAKQVKVLVNPIPVFGNGLNSGPLFFNTSVPTKQIVDGVDGGIAESWIRGSGTPMNNFPPLADWKNNVDMITVTEQEAKPLLVIEKIGIAATRAQQDQWFLYGLASFLLGSQGRSAFSFTGSSSTDRTTVYPAYATNLGTPVGAYALTGGAYQRHFTNGLVLVNPTNTAVTVTLGGTYFDSRGRSVTSVKMNADTGILLTKTAPAASLTDTSLPAPD
jgi:hypothetical protein